MFNKIFVVIVFFLLTSINAYANTGENLNESIKDLSHRIDVIEYKIPLFFEEKLNSQGDNILNKVTSISNQGMSEQQKLIAQQQTGLTIFSITFTIISILLGIYITWILSKIQIIKNDAKEIELEVQSMLEKKSEELYQRIQDADTNSIFKRLKEYPEEIQNVFSMLATRKISTIHFDFLKKQSILFKDTYNEIGNNYKLLMLQHFYSQMLTDESLNEILQKDINLLITGCFPKEINDMFEEIANKYIKNENNENYLWFLRAIKRHVSPQIISIINNRFIDNDKQSLLEKLNSTIITTAE